jgi:hypothetical protein
VHRSTGGGPSIVVGIHLPGTSDDLQIPEAVMNRLFCHVLIQHLQDRGLPEAVDRLSDMVGFYENPPPIYRQLTHGPTVVVKMGASTIRPVYPVTEED